MKKTVSIFGATGSIGQNTVDLLCENPDLFSVEVLVAKNNAKQLAENARLLSARKVVIENEKLYSELKQELSGSNIKFASGKEAIIEAAQQNVDWAMAAVAGTDGIASTVELVKHAKTLAIANKESLVSAGNVIMPLAKTCGTKILPVDSEHNAIFQSIQNHKMSEVESITLTASGGPFWRKPKEEFKDIVPEMALKHPKWSMGKKVSIDSATLMNKGLEFIEAHYLFQMPVEKINVLVHPQAIVHGMATFIDGSFIAQLGTPDMKIPISYTMAWPERLQTKCERLSPSDLSKLEFFAPDHDKFPALKLAIDSICSGVFAPIVMNAANEVAVYAFLNKQISFLDINRVLNRVLNEVETFDIQSIDDILQLDCYVKEMTKKDMNRLIA